MRYFSRVYAYLRVALRSREEAEDVAQQVFTRAFEALPKYEHRGPFRGWLFAIARNQAISHLRAAQRLEPLDPDDLNRRRDQRAESGPLPALEWISDPDLLLFIERLPLAQRQVLVLRYMLDLNHAEIATVLGRSPEDVRKLQSRAQRFLRDRLDALAQRAEVECRPRMVARPAHHYILRRRRYALMRSSKGSGSINR
jgi:RNA polymerase sigma-70 factor (ECF subfamily)